MFTKDKNNHKQEHCGKALLTLEDYIGGGSHYWVLFCTECKKRFTFDTHRFELEEWEVSNGPEIGSTGSERSIDDQ